MTVRRSVKNPRVGERSATHGFPRLQHAGFGADRESACFGLSKDADLQLLHAGGGTRTPDTRIMMTARRGHQRLNRHGSGAVRCPQFGPKSGVGRTVWIRTLRSGA